MSGTLFQFPKAIAWDAGTAQAGATLTFSQTGTSTPQNIYTDLALTTAHSNPVTADAEGVFAPIYLDPSLPDYRVVFRDSGGTIVYTVDDIPAGTSSANNLTLEDTAPYLLLSESDATANEQNWRIIASGDQLLLQTGNDALDTFVTILTIDRTATAVAYVDIDDTSFRIGGVEYFPPVVKYKASDETRTSTDTVADDSELAGWALEADTAYQLEAFLSFSTASATPDVKWFFGYTNAPQGDSAYLYVAGDNNGTDITSGYNVTTGTPVSIELPANAPVAVSFKGIIRSNATTGGTVDFMWAQNTSDANQVVLQTGSWMSLRKLGTA